MRTRTGKIVSTLSGACLCLSLAPPTAAAQDSAAQPAQNARGPMVVERVKGGFVLAPDVKITEVNRETSELVGAYGGWLFDGQLLVGGGGYWLANGARDREMAYGGAVIGWFVRTDRRIGFGVKALVGGGQATTEGTFRDLFGMPDRPFGLGISDLFDGRMFPRPITLTAPVRVRQGFSIAEPEANLLVNLTSRLRLTGGISYRLIGGTTRGVGRQLRGTTGSVALQIGG